jgi:hypothetical protein
VSFVRALPQKARSSAPKPEISDEVRQILHRVGLALIIFGLLDIGRDPSLDAVESKLIGTLQWEGRPR